MSEQQSIETIRQIIAGILGQMGIEAEIEVEDAVTGLVFNLHSPETQSLIGRQGSHLHALQILTQQIAIKQLGFGSVPRYTIDVDDYRKKREWYLKETARQAIEKAKRLGKPVALDPMPNYERRLIHAYIQEHFADVQTDSTGDGTARRIVIRAQ